MNILFIAKNIPSPGNSANDIIIEIAHRLREHGAKLDFIFPKEFVPWGFHFINKYKHLWKLKPWKTRGFKVYPYNYYRIPISRWAFILNDIQSIKLPSTINITTYDLVHAHLLFPDALIGMQIKKKYALPLIVTIRAADINLLKKVKKNSHTWNTAKQLLQECDAVLTLNSYAKKFIYKKFDIASEIIPHGLDFNLYGQNIIFENKSIDILVVASAIKRKKIDWVIRAFKEYRGPENHKLVVAGDGPELQGLMDLAEDNEDISFKGQIPRKEVIQLMRSSKLFALPSKRETFGRVYIEAAAQKCALIAHKDTGIDGVFGTDDGVSFVSDYKEFKTQLHKFLTGEENLKSMGEKAYHKSLQLTWDQVIKKYYNTYNLVR
jgi:hypothetical protein